MAAMVPKVAEGQVWCPLCRQEMSKKHYDTKHKTTLKHKTNLARTYKPNTPLSASFTSLAPASGYKTPKLQDKAASGYKTPKLPDKVAKSQDEGLSIECVVCFETANSALGCGHLCMCMACAAVQKRMRNGCPICRRPINSILRIFTP